MFLLHSMEEIGYLQIVRHIAHSRYAFPPIAFYFTDNLFDGFQIATGNINYCILAAKFLCYSLTDPLT